MTHLPATPIETLERARDIGSQSGLRFVYLGNVPNQGANTICYNCRGLDVRRSRWRVEVLGLNGSRCKYCDAELNFRTQELG
jgi:pyruvate formate lyase activating enzyme